MLDSSDSAVQTNMQTAVSYLTSGSAGILTGHTVTLDIVTSMDNDSFGALDQGEKQMTMDSLITDSG